MTGRLILVAHGETAATRRAAFALDDPLTPRGQAAAARYAAILPRADTVLRSPALAAAESAAAIGCAAAVEPALADLDCGRWRGLTLGEIADAEPQNLGAWLADPAYAGHGGGSIDGLLHRVTSWLAAMREDRGTALAITHAAVLRCAVLATLGAPADGFWKIDIAPLTRVTLSSDGRRWSLRALQRNESPASG